MFMVSIYNHTHTNNWNDPKYPSAGKWINYGSSIQWNTGHSAVER